MELTIEPTSELSGSVKTPPSKSITIRAVVAGLLSEGKTTVRNPLDSLDTRACMSAAEMLGAKITGKDGAIIVDGVGREIKIPNQIIDTQNSGTTIRIMTAVASLACGKVRLTGDESIQKRPIKPMLKALEDLGVVTESTNGFPPHSVRGPIVGRACSITGDISSQFISGLLMATPYAHADTIIEITTPLRSRPYVDLTLDMLHDFRIKVKNENYDRFFVPKEQTYRACDYTVEGDYSSAAFVVGAAAATKSRVTIQNLRAESKQADKKILDIARQMGATVKSEKNSVTISGNGKISGVTVDLSDSPDLVPIVAALGTIADDETIIENAAHARLKECDRIHAMTIELSKMGAKVTEKQDGLIIKGGNLKGACLEGWKDHRIVMALSVAALRAKGKTTITDAEMIPVTFPNYVKAMQKLGAKIK